MGRAAALTLRWRGGRAGPCGRGRARAGTAAGARTGYDAA
jgi:hypothetical protein